MYACGWAVSTTAATIGFRAFDGTTETTLLAAANPLFDNSTTTPGWVAKMYKPATGWTQAALDALAFRVGFSTDATPDIGVHAVYAEVAVQTSEVAGVFGLAGSDRTMVESQTDPVSGGIEGLTVTTPPSRSATLTYEKAGSPTTVVVPPETVQTEVIDAADAATVNRIDLSYDPEGVADT
jgi:hypothetical protein